MEMLPKQVAESVSPEEAAGIEEMMGTLSDNNVFRSMHRSIKNMTPASSDVNNILEFKKNTMFDFVQSVLLPEQGLGTEDRPHIFKMSVKGSGSGLALIRRMQKGGDLEHCWMMTDVMHRCSDGWLTMTAAVYDHLYRGLCTVFTCELRSEDAPSLQTAWRVMRRTCAKWGLKDVQFAGFIADNAAAGWNAIRDEFWGGRVNSCKERSDSFHWAQSVERAKSDIIPSLRQEHVERLESLRDAGNVIYAYRIWEDMRVWWKNGAALPGKMKDLDQWMSWWIVRFSQWGNFIRLVSIS